MNWTTLQKILRAALLSTDAENAKLREELAAAKTDAEAWRLTCKGKEGSFVKLLAFAELVEPYVANDYCHDKSPLGQKLYSACLEIREHIYGKGALAHQQPSAPICPDCKQPLTGDDMLDREVHGRCSLQGEQSAPTPDVKQIADEYAELLHRPKISQDGLREGLLAFAAQARAPLVAALEQIRDCDWTVGLPMARMRDIAAQALTGTLRQAQDEAGEKPL